MLIVGLIYLAVAIALGWDLGGPTGSVTGGAILTAITWFASRHD